MISTHSTSRVLCKLVQHCPTARQPGDGAAPEPAAHGRPQPTAQGQVCNLSLSLSKQSLWLCLFCYLAISAALSRSLSLSLSLSLSDSDSDASSLRLLSAGVSPMWPPDGDSSARRRRILEQPDRRKSGVGSPPAIWPPTTQPQPEPEPEPRERASHVVPSHAFSHANPVRPSRRYRGTGDAYAVPRHAEHVCSGGHSHGGRTWRCAPAAPSPGAAAVIQRGARRWTLGLDAPAQRCVSRKR